ncbi:MAG: ABC transporter ATP-binding protein [Liquorilactobacillus nagelii]|jgi:ATP-binding cassette subfamily B protein|uniref:Multidrug ABC transporter ATP-binding protein n=1 Tax=Liquorilactobacillus nagelii TaxID=82688 RepID=A0A3S6QWJ2_9LACO|nr:ABC transporter ATP-binding protein [Liquorilactobacillus nagelii]AUJ32532.1 multidrug ABC transporter ATP-binding protein [Liquorilactobacillus nagelii]MCC7617142.1 multidrug ABC transporter ATP-binding protein [Liquorilactobacillus nagelii]MCP9316030.1 ABC transporter ATP-binding protein [Liquorilactobacillus nagelii]
MPQHGPAANIGKEVEKPKNFWQTTWRLCKYMAPWKWFLFIVFAFAIGSVIFQIISPKILGEATTTIFNGLLVGYRKIKVGQHLSRFPINFTKIKNILLTVGIMYLISAILSFFQQLIMANISQKIVYRLRADLKAKMQRLPIVYYDTHSNGDIMSRAINDMDNIAGTLQQSLAQIVTSAVTFVGVLFMMLTISWEMTLIACITVPLGIIVIAAVAPRSQKYFAAQQKSLGLLNDQVEESFSGHTVVKTFNREETSIAAFKEQNQIYYHSSWKAQFISGLIMPLMNFVSNIGYVCVAVVGGLKVANGQLTLGNVQAFLQYVNQFTQPITQLANLANTIQATVASAERIFQVLDEPEMQKTSVPIANQTATPAKIQFEHVDFGYAQKETLIKNMNLKVVNGEKIAIVGPTGAGKTTLINLLERFYDIKDGSLKLDGRDTRNLLRSQVRKHFAMVLQDTWLFTGSIYENIKYGRENATEAEIYQAAKAAHADTFIRQLPQGYATVLNEEASNISQGQRQLLTIARAFLADPEILILDEATSSVDTRTEILIQHAMDRLLSGRTSFVVAHRLSTIRDADKILVMNHGSIIETGSHTSLMAAKGFYADLYNSQFTAPSL